MRNAPLAEASESELVGTTLSMRITVDAVSTGSTLPALSTEKYWIVYWPVALSEMDVPWVELVVGVEPSVV